MMHAKLSRRELLTALPVGALVATTPVARAEPSQAGLSFLAVGDWGRNGAYHQTEVARQMGSAAASINAGFVISVGDNFYEDGVQSAQDPQWKTSFEDVYVEPSLQAPWYAVLGNHDYRGVPQAQIDYAKTSQRWKMPNRYYKVSGDEIGWPLIDMFVIDSSPLVNEYREKVHSKIADNVRTQDTAAQLAWLDAELGRSTAAWKIVFGHHTIYSGGSEHGNTSELLAQIKPILERHGVQAYLNGHEHDLQHIRVGQIDYICSGAGSEVRPTGPIPGTRFCLARSGFAKFKMIRDSLELSFVDYMGASVYHTVIARERA